MRKPVLILSLVSAEQSPNASGSELKIDDKSHVLSRHTITCPKLPEDSILTKHVMI